MHHVVRVAVALVGLASCGGHYHGYYETPPPPPPLEYRHYHRLDCDHLVECRYYRGGHHYAPHRRHDRYWHVHRTRRGQYKRCYVVRHRHDYYK